MRKTTMILLLTCAWAFAHAQVNCVLNGGFEQYTTCPTMWNQIRMAKYWQPIDTVDVAGFGPLCSPEYCNACAGTSIYVGIPSNGWFYHYPRTGNGMVMSVMYYYDIVTFSYQRDYSQGKLYTHLVAGKDYCITFYATLTHGSKYAVNKIGAYLDDGSIDAGQDSAGCALPQTAFTPQVFTTTIIDDTLNWVKIQGSFTATGTERFITIGNFFSNANTDTITHYSTTTHTLGVYLIDDVSVIASDAVADAGTSHLMGLGDSTHIGTYEDGMPSTWYVLGNPTPIGYGGGIWVHPAVTTSYVVALDLCSGITYDTATIYVCPAGVSALSFPGELLQLYPNPATTELHIDHAANCDVTITNLLGQQVLRTRLSNDKAVVNIEGLAKGIYTALLTDPATGNSVVRKLVLSN